MPNFLTNSFDQFNRGWRDQYGKGSKGRKELPKDAAVGQPAGNETYFGGLPSPTPSPTPQPAISPRPTPTPVPPARTPTYAGGYPITMLPTDVAVGQPAGNDYQAMQPVSPQGVPLDTGPLVASALSHWAGNTQPAAMPLWSPTQNQQGNPVSNMVSRLGTPSGTGGAGAGAYGTVGDWMSGAGSAGAAGSLGSLPFDLSMGAPIGSDPAVGQPISGSGEYNQADAYARKHMSEDEQAYVDNRMTPRLANQMVNDSQGYMTGKQAATDKYRGLLDYYQMNWGGPDRGGQTSTSSIRGGSPTPMGAQSGGKQPSAQPALAQHAAPAAKVDPYASQYPGYSVGPVAANTPPGGQGYVYPTNYGWAPRAQLVGLPAGQGAQYDPRTFGITPNTGTENAPGFGQWLGHLFGQIWNRGGQPQQGFAPGVSGNVYGGGGGGMPTAQAQPQTYNPGGMLVQFSPPQNQTPAPRAQLVANPQAQVTTGPAVHTMPTGLSNIYPDVGTGGSGTYTPVTFDQTMGAPLRGPNLDISKDPAVGQFFNPGAMVGSSGMTTGQLGGMLGSEISKIGSNAPQFSLPSNMAPPLPQPAYFIPPGLAPNTGGRLPYTV